MKDLEKQGEEHISPSSKANLLCLLPSPWTTDPFLFFIFKHLSFIVKNKGFGQIFSALPKNTSGLQTE